MKRVMQILRFFVLSVILVHPISAKVGIGAHWGFDLSVSTDEVYEQAVFEQLSLDINAITSGTNPFPPSVSTITGDRLPVFIERTSMNPGDPVLDNKFSFGGKLFVDIIPVLDAVELSLNFGVWEYQGKIAYPTSIDWSSTPPADPFSASINDLYVVNYDTINITIADLNVPYLGLSGTPYAKLHFDLSVRKYLVRVPGRLKTLNLYAGGGLSMHLATPVLSAKLIENALEEQLTQSFSSVSAMGADFLGQPEIMKAVLDEIVTGFLSPKLGAHILVGAMVKIPVLPISVNIDGKLQLPFASFDDYVDVSGVGLLINTGIGLYF